MHNLPNNLEFVTQVKDLLRKEYHSNMLNLCVSGSRLYGTNSVDSDIDYRGAFIMDTDRLLGIHSIPDHVNRDFGDNDLAMNEIKKEIGLIVKNNCNIIEHIFAPQIESTKEFLQLKDLAESVIAKNGLFDSYKGMATENYKKFVLTRGKNSVKKYLYVLRALMAGIHVLKVGKIQPNIQVLNNGTLFQFKEVDQLVDLKIRGKEWDLVSGLDEDKVRSLIDKLFAEIEEAYVESSLPETPSKESVEALNIWLLKIRKRGVFADCVVCGTKK